MGITITTMVNRILEECPFQEDKVSIDPRGQETKQLNSFAETAC